MMKGIHLAGQRALITKLTAGTILNGYLEYLKNFAVSLHRGLFINHVFYEHSSSIKQTDFQLSKIKNRRHLRLHAKSAAMSLNVFLYLGHVELVRLFRRDVCGFSAAQPNNLNWQSLIQVYSRLRF